jgi:hypothetical protein
MLRTGKAVALIGAVLTVAAATVPVSAADLAADLGGGWRGPYRPVWGPPLLNGVPVSYGYGLCYQWELLQTPWGPRMRLVNHCN